MTNPKIRFSAHVQLQYLKSKFKISDQQLTIDMATYYCNEAFSLKRTIYGKITAVSVREGMTAPPLRKPLNKAKQRSQTKKIPRTPKPFKTERYVQPVSHESRIAVPVVVKKRRIVNR